MEVRTGQLWEFTDRSGAARLARVVRVSEAIAGVRHVYLRRVGSGMNMRSTVQRLERQIDGVRLVEDSDGLQPPAPAPDRRERVVVEVPRSKGLLQPRMSAEVRREAIAAAKRMQARGCTAREIGETLSVLPEIVEDWLRDLPVTK